MAFDHEHDLGEEVGDHDAEVEDGFELVGDGGGVDLEAGVLFDSDVAV